MLRARRSAMVMIAAGLTVVATACPPPNPPTPGSYLRTTSAPTALSAAGATPVLVTSVIVPAGNWLVTAKTTAVNFAGADYVRCNIKAGATLLDGGTTLVGNASGGPTGETGPSAATIVMQGLASTTSIQTVTLNCEHDFAIAGEYIDPGAALRVVPATGALAATTTASTSLSASGATPVTVASVSVPAGSWSVSAKATGVNFAGADDVRCDVKAASTLVDGATTLVGNAAGGPTGEKGPSAAMMAMQGLITTATTQTFSLNCQHDFGIAGEYIDPQASLIVVPSSGGSSSSTTASTTLSPSAATATTITSLSVAAGTWSVSAKATAVNFGGADYVRCTISAGASALDASTTLVGNAFGGPTAETGPSAAMVAEQSLVTTTSVTTLSLTCLHDFSFSGEYIDPQASLVAVPAAGPIG